MLKLTHTLVVNTEKSAHISRAQLWNGLLLRIVEPMHFTIGLDAVKMLEQTASGYRRALYFGEHVVQDIVTLVDGESVEFVTIATETAPSGKLLIAIEGDGGDDLHLKFVYNTQFPDPSNDEERGLLEMIKNAYMAADEDTVRIIREHALAVRH